MRFPSILQRLRSRAPRLSTKRFVDIPVQGMTLGASESQRLRPLPVVILVILLIASGIAYVFVSPPRYFPVGQMVVVPADVGVRTIAADLYAANVIRSPLAFHVYTRLRGMDRDLAAGPYVFERRLGVFGVANRVARGDHGIAALQVTLTEGMTIDDMARELAEKIPGFDSGAFLEQSSDMEGYLFPDTYRFLPDVTPEEVVLLLRTRFDERLATVMPAIEQSGRSAEDVVIMASLLEREANTVEDMHLVSGILWNRIDADMPLQVDAVFGYIHGINGYTPTAADLKLDSPYNTYLYKGFPPTPISNPGLDALRAAATPTETEYFYYLTGRDGNMYYGRTFEEHVANRREYLDVP